MAGGDGSLAAVAAVALERDVPFVCVPFGTRNHFARDLGLDRDDPLGAVRAFGGAERRIDVGRADRRLFLNNVSLGVYAWLVHRREHHRRRRVAFARVRAWAAVLTHRQPLGLAIDRSAERFVVSAAAGRLDAAIDGEPEVLQTPIEFRIEPRALRVLVPDGGG